MKRIFSFLCALVLLAGLLPVFSMTVAAEDEIDFDDLINAAGVTIIKEPEDVFVAVGETASTSVEAVGSNLVYTWYFNDGDGYKKSSITTNTYTAVMEAWRSGRKVYCVVANKYDPDTAVTSAVATLAVLPEITKQPANASAPNGAQVKTTLTATGDGLKYEWYIKNKDATTWSKSSLTGDSYYVTMKDTTDGRQVYCVVTDKYGHSVQSNVATLSMKNTLKITQQPTNASAPDGQQVKTTITATGDGLKYIWYFYDAGMDGYALSSITTNTYTTTMDSRRNGRKVYCEVVDKYGNRVNSSVATLSMGGSAKITAQPKNAVAPNGTQVKTTLTATGDGLKYEWYFKNAGSSTWSKSSLTGNSYYVTMKSTTKGRQVYCVVTDQYGNSVKSNVATLNMK